MSTIESTAERGPVGSLIFVVGALGLLSLTVLIGMNPLSVAPVVAIGILLVLGHQKLLAWPSLISLMLLVILFVPMRRYTLPGSLPFELDPFRVVVLFVLAGWIASLLADPRVQFRRSGFEAPLLLVLAATFASILVNGDRVSQVGSSVAKELTFFLSYLVVFFLIVSVSKASHIDAFIKILVGGGAVVAACAIVESRTHVNPFDHLSTVVPFLQSHPDAHSAIDGRGFRAFGSAQHPIALSAAFVLLLPISLYLVQKSGTRRWWLAGGLLLTGTLATMSRTSVIMLFVVGLVFVWLRPREMRRLWPAIIPALVVIHVLLPGTLGTLKQSFFPTGGLVAQQTANPGYTGQGRLADVAPALEKWSSDPVFGLGFGTRVIGAEGTDGQILDDQWLGTLLETGIPGAVGWLWLMVLCIRRFAGGARADRSSRGWLLTALAAAVAAFAAGMLFYDTFAFIQVSLLFFVLIALGSVVLRSDRSIQPVGGVERIG